MGYVRRNRPPVITDADYSQDDQLMSREIRYVIMMGIRVLCLIAAAILVGVHAHYLAVWLPLLLFGMIILPWLAVILANDRPAKEKYRLVNRLHLRKPSEPATDPAITAADHKIVDHKVIDHDD